MIQPIDRAALLAVAADCGWPSVRLATVTLDGEASWRGALTGCPAATPGERLALLRRLEPFLLVATEGGRARMAAWDTRPERPVALSSPEALRDRIAYHGDRAVLPLVVEAFRRLPPPARETLLDEVLILGVGASQRGWAGPARILMRPGALPPVSLMVIDASGPPDVTLKTTLHECAHAWHAGPSGPCTGLLRAAVEERTLACARAEGWPALAGYERGVARDERLADALATVWAAE